MTVEKGVGLVLQQGQPQSTPGDIGCVSSVSAFGHCKHAPEQMASVRGNDEKACGVVLDCDREGDCGRTLTAPGPGWSREEGLFEIQLVASRPGVAAPIRLPVPLDSARPMIHSLTKRGQPTTRQTAALKAFSWKERNDIHAHDSSNFLSNFFFWPRNAV
jgi:hypothetical protein